MDKNLILLPAKFRKIGISLVIGSVILAIVAKPALPSFQLSPELKELIFHTLFGLINLGLFFIFYARMHKDDEMTVQMKLKATMISVLFATLMFIVKPIIDTLFGDPINISAAYTIMLIQIMQITNYWMMKRKLKKELAYDEE